MDIICKKLANEMFYAYHKGRFWRWDDARGVWKEIHLMTQKFERAKAAIATLTPEDFLSGAEFEQPDEYELDFAMVDALKSAKPCKTAPIEPVEKAECEPGLSHAQTCLLTREASQPVTSSAPAGSAGSSSASGDAISAASTAPAVSTETLPTSPTFDFGADDQTNALLLQDAQTFITGNMARIMAAKHAHDLTANHYKGSWGKWCAAVGISRDTGDRMVSVAAQCGNIELEGKSILDVQPMKLLYAAAKPSTPEEVKQAVFSGDITTYKEYQELMAQFKAEKDRADTAEHQLEAAHADINGLTEQNSQLKERVDSAEAREEEAWKMQSKAEARAKTAEEALKKQPLVGVTDKDEVQRQAKVLASQWREEEIDKLATDKSWGIADARNAELLAEKEQVEKRAADLEQQLAKAQAAPSVDPQEYIEVVEGGRINMDSTYNMIRPAFKHLIGSGEPFDKMAEDMIALCNHIRDDMVEMIIENDKVTQYE